MQEPITEKLRAAIREVPDFPKPGINFYDITTLLKAPQLFAEVIEFFVERYRPADVQAIVGIEARGFIFGGALAQQLGKAFVPVRKPGKLPAETIRVAYSLEYGEDALEIHKDALSPGQKVVIIDDLLATGGTAKGTIDLVSKLGAEILECAFVVELGFLEGRQKLSPTPMISLITYDQ